MKPCSQGMKCSPLRFPGIRPNKRKSMPRVIVDRKLSSSEVRTWTTPGQLNSDWRPAYDQQTTCVIRREEETTLSSLSVGKCSCSSHGVPQNRLTLPASIMNSIAHKTKVSTKRTHNQGYEASDKSGERKTKDSHSATKALDRKTEEKKCCCSFQVSFWMSLSMDELLLDVGSSKQPNEATHAPKRNALEIKVLNLVPKSKAKHICCGSSSSSRNAFIEKRLPGQVLPSPAETSPQPHQEVRSPMNTQSSEFCNEAEWRVYYQNEK